MDESSAGVTKGKDRQAEEGRCRATWERELKLPWREAGPPNYLDDKVDSDQQVVNIELSLSLARLDK